MTWFQSSKNAASKPTRSKLKIFLEQFLDVRSQNGGAFSSIGQFCRTLSWMIFTKIGKCFFLETQKAFSIPGKTFCKRNLLRLGLFDQLLKSSKFRLVGSYFVVEISVKTFCQNAFSFEKIWVLFCVLIRGIVGTRKRMTETSLV